MTEPNDTQSKKLPTSARVVVLGGGMTGCSVAYHLTKRGWSDVVLLERHSLACGTTWHAPGLVGLLRPTLNMTRLAMHTNEVLPQLEKETGLSTGFKQNGTVIVTAERNRHEQLRRLAQSVGRFGLDLHEISIAEASQMWPLADTSDLVGAFSMPSEGQTSPMDTLQAYAKGARMGGAKIFEHTKATGLLKKNDEVTGVSTPAGDIKAEFVVNCTGMWGWEVGQQADVPLPIHAVEQHYLVTEAMPDVSPGLPILRDLQNGLSTRADAGQLTIGFMSPVGEKPWGMEGIPESFAFDELPDDHEFLEIIIERVLKRIPALGNVGIRTFFTGPEGISTDACYFLGEAPGVKNYMVAAGMSNMGIGSSGGIGRTMAEMIVDGEPSIDLWEVDPRRAAPFESNRKYQYDRVAEVGGALYELIWPFFQATTARGIRRSPIHDRLVSAGAFFEVSQGWERPAWFNAPGNNTELEYKYDRQAYVDSIEGEYRALDAGVGLSDLSSYAKILVQGTDAAKTLEKLCANRVSVGAGRSVQTPMLNELGKVETWATIHWLADNKCLIVSETSSQTRLHDWINKHIPESDRTAVTDVTSGYAIIGLAGMYAADLLAQISSYDFTAESFAIDDLREIDAGFVRAHLSRTLDLAVPNWELIIPTESAAALYEYLLEKGSDLGLAHIGSYTRRTLLLEAGVPEWGKLVASAGTPVDGDMERWVSFDKPAEFIGRERALEASKVGSNRRLVRLSLEESDPILFGGEPILRNGKVVGLVSACGYTNRYGGGIAAGYVENEGTINDAYLQQGRYAIRLAGQDRPAKLHRVSRSEEQEEHQLVNV